MSDAEVLAEVTDRLDVARNLEVKVDGDTARCTSCQQATHYVEDGDAWTSDGPAEIRCARPDGWQIGRRRFTRQWRRDPNGLSLKSLAN